MAIPTPNFRYFEAGQPPEVVQPKTVAPADLRWLRVEEFLRSRELSANTRKAYTRDLYRWVEWTDKPWHTITHRDVDRFKQHLQQLRSPQGKLLTPATVSRTLAALQSFFKWLTVKDYIGKNPTLTLEKPQPDPIQPQDLTEDEVKALYGALAYRGEQEVRDTALLQVLEHGLRASEVAALNVEDYEGQRLHIRQAKGDSVGTVPLLQAARRSLDAYLGWRLRQGLPTTPDSPLFLSHSNNSKGQRLSYWGMYSLIEELADLAGVKDCHPNRLSHTFATQLVLRQMDPTLARKLTRHRSESSFQRYSDRALAIQAEQQFYQVMGEAEAKERRSSQ